VERAPDVRLEFDNNAAAPRQARQALSILFTDRDDPIADTVTLAASELVSNVVRHTNSSGVMQAWDPKPDVPLRLEVEDFLPTLPAIATDPVFGGRGLKIVDTLADAWGVDPTINGKVVWAEFNRPAYSSPRETETAVDPTTTLRHAGT
jgi:hypothetical protein